MTMADFVFLFRGGEPLSESPARMQQQMERWIAWMKELGDKGHLQNAGSALERTGKIVSGKKKRAITDGPFAEKDLVGGVMFIAARDLGHAAEIATGCPIFESDGFVEVRPVMKTSP
jgi:hypothetical protein